MCSRSESGKVYRGPRRCKLRPRGHTDKCDLPLTFSQTSTWADELTEGFSTRKQCTQNSPNLPCVARSCFSVAGTKYPLGHLP